MKKLAAILILILLSGVAQAQNICISPTGTTTAPNCTASEALEVAITGVSGVELPNDTYLTATDAAGTGTIDVLKVDGTDDTVLNVKSGELIKLSENGTAGLAIDPSTNTYTFASRSTLGSNDTTDGIAAAYFTDGTAKASIDFTSNTFRIGTIGANMVRFMYNNATEIVMNNTNFYPNADGGNALGASTNGWNGLYLSNGTDKWSFVPGTNLLTLAAGADDQTAKICGGSAAATTNGACVNLLGDDVGGADAGGNLEFRPSDNAAAVSKFYTPSASLAWSVGANITQDATSGGNIVMTKAGTGVQLGAAIHANVLSIMGTSPPIATAVNNSSYYNQAMVAFGANSAGPNMVFLKTRAAADTSAGTIVNGGDIVGSFLFYGADGTNYDQAAKLEVNIDGTPGAGTDMPGRFVFSVSPDGSATPVEAMRISQDKSITIAAGLKSSATDVGWVVRAGADTACTTTCGANKGCLFGIDAGTAAVVACATATADTCLCSQ